MISFVGLLYDANIHSRFAFVAGQTPIEMSEIVQFLQNSPIGVSCNLTRHLVKRSSSLLETAKLRVFS